MTRLFVPNVGEKVVKLMQMSPKYSAHAKCKNLTGMMWKHLSDM